MPHLKDHMRNRLLPTLASLIFTVGIYAADPTPHWLWSGANGGTDETVTFRKSFTVEGKVTNAKLSVSGDNHVIVWVNGQQVGKSDEWNEPATIDITKHVIAGSNVIAIQGKNDEAGPAGVVARLKFKDATGKDILVVSDTSWKQGAVVNGWEKSAFDDSAWKAPHDLGALGTEPWGNIFSGGKGGSGSGVLAADALVMQPGFSAELIYTVPKGEQGSWVSLAVDHKGRLITSDQSGAGLYRITPPPAGGTAENTIVEKIDIPITGAHGLLYAFDSLYVCVNGGNKEYGSGLYRLQDTNGDDKFDKVTVMNKFKGGGEHGPHSVIVAPDGKSLYVNAGNHTAPLDKFDTYLAPKIWAEDIFLPRHWDPNGHAKGVIAPGGWIARTDPEGKSWDLVSISYRNQVDMAKDGNGEVFTWDSDMEWDFGTPWYRPTRVCHVTSGSDFGWRSGSGNPLPYVAETLPPVIDIGPGSPVGTSFGTGAKFPAKYQQALFILDWTYGTMYAIHLEPQGASFKATKEDFVSGKPLPFTDMVIGHDGAMYFAIGGRGTQSALYRVTYTGKESTAAVKAVAPTELAGLRHKLETFHGRQNPAAVAAAWPELGNADRFIRFAARTAIEHQPVATWQDKVFGEAKPQARITALIALARCGDKALQAKALTSALELDIAQMNVDLQLEALRAIQLLVTRMGMPDATMAKRITDKLDPLFPSSDWRLNRELSAVLCVLGSPTAVAKSLFQMASNETSTISFDLGALIARNPGYGKDVANTLASKPQQQQLAYALALSTTKVGWTANFRQQYFAFFQEAETTGKGGNSYKGFIRVIRKDAWDNVPEGERQAVTDSLAKITPAKEAPVVQAKGPGRNWTMAEAAAMAQAPGALSKRDFTNGKNLFAASQCTACHRFATEGGAAGPDLSSVGTKFSARDLLESIIEPSKVISDQYQSTMIVTKDGGVFMGRVITEDGKNLTIATNPIDASLITTVAIANIASKSVLKSSIMPAGLIDRLNQDEMLDLLAYLISGGNDKDKMFQH